MTKCLCNFPDPSFKESCRLFEWSYDNIYVQWTRRRGAAKYRIAWYSNNTSVTRITTSRTYYLITGVQQGQRYDITVTALTGRNAAIDSFTCSGETGDGQLVTILYLSNFCHRIYAMSLCLSVCLSVCLSLPPSRAGVLSNG